MSCRTDSSFPPRRSTGLDACCADDACYHEECPGYPGVDDCGHFGGDGGWEEECGADACWACWHVCCVLGVLAGQVERT